MKEHPRSWPRKIMHYVPGREKTNIVADLPHVCSCLSSLSTSSIVLLDKIHANTDTHIHQQEHTHTTHTTKHITRSDHGKRIQTDNCLCFHIPLGISNIHVQIIHSTHIDSTGIEDACKSIRLWILLALVRRAHQYKPKEFSVFYHITWHTTQWNWLISIRNQVHLSSASVGKSICR